MKVYNIIDPKELRRFGFHSIRVEAAVTLHINEEYDQNKMEVRYLLSVSKECPSFSHATLSHCVSLY